MCFFLGALDMWNGLQEAQAAAEISRPVGHVVGRARAGLDWSVAEILRVRRQSSGPKLMLADALSTKGV